MQPIAALPFVINNTLGNVALFKTTLNINSHTTVRYDGSTYTVYYMSVCLNFYVSSLENVIERVYG